MIRGTLDGIAYIARDDGRIGWCSDWAEMATTQVKAGRVRVEYDRVTGYAHDELFLV